MKNKINVAKLLKDCPEGMELDCTIWDNVTLVSVDNEDIPFPIKLSRKNDDGSESYFVTTEYGQYYSNSKCVIFPKGKTTWEGFQTPFKDGDIAISESGDWIGIVNSLFSGNDCYEVYVVFENFGKYSIIHKNAQVTLSRLATEEEKQKLFQAIKDNGYKWNPETKTLEKLVEPKFKVGDRIIHKSTKLYCTLGEYSEGISAYRTNIGLSITYKDLEQWELAPNKFDITNLIPFESKVLVRDIDNDTWYPAIWGCTGIPNIDTYPYIVLGGVGFEQCIPYKGNEHLLGTNNDCDEYYKIWE